MIIYKITQIIVLLKKCSEEKWANKKKVFHKYSNNVEKDFFSSSRICIRTYLSFFFKESQPETFPYNIYFFLVLKYLLFFTTICLFV